MTIDDLLASGFKRFKPNQQFDKWTDGYQLRVRDEHGTRYFIQVYRWEFTANCPEGWETEVYYNDGSPWHPRAAVIIKAYAGVEQWTANDVIAWAEQLWDRLWPVPYERD